jgi:hypothetical protein
VVRGRTFDVTARGNRHVYDDCAGLHAVEDVLLDEERSLPSENFRRRDDDVSLLAYLCLSFLLLCNLLGGKLLGITL